MRWATVDHRSWYVYTARWKTIAHLTSEQIETSCCRVFRFGPVVLPAETHLYRWRCVSRRLTKISGLAFNDMGSLDPCNLLLGVQHSSVATPIEAEPALPSIPGLVPTLADYGPGRWHYSEASLAKVISLQTCTKVDQLGLQCIGVLLKSSDGMIDVLGQWRPDLASQAFPFTGRISICCETLGNRRRIRTVCVDGGKKLRTAEKNVRWRRAGRGSVLIWWFNRHHVVVSVSTKQ